MLFLIKSCGGGGDHAAAQTPAAVREDPAQSLLERLGELDQRRDATVACSAGPLLSGVSAESQARNVSSHYGHEDGVYHATYSVPSHRIAQSTIPSENTARGAAGGRAHSCSTQPCPGIPRTAWPFARSTRSPSPSGRPANHSRSPASASAWLSTWGFRSERRSSSRRRRSNSLWTERKTNLLRLRSWRSISRTNSAGSVTVTRSYSEPPHGQGRTRPSAAQSSLRFP